MADSNETSPRPKPPSKRRRGIGKPFPKGVSGNPGGRSAEREELRRYLRESFGRGAIEGIARMAGLVEGAVACSNQKVRLAAYRWLADQSIGKATQALSGPDGEPLNLFDFSSLSIEQLEQLEQIRRALKVKP